MDECQCGEIFSEVMLKLMRKAERLGTARLTESELWFMIQENPSLCPRCKKDDDEGIDCGPFKIID